MVELNSNYQNLTDRQYFHILMNMESHTSFLPRAQELAKKYLQDGRDKLDRREDIPETLYRFDYSYDALAARLDKIYDDLSKEADAVLEIGSAKRNTYFEFWTDERVRERLIQFAPFNMTDGAWLQNITRAGTVTKARSMLFSIWADEVGNGEESHNHSNIYHNLLRSLGIYFERPDTTDFAHDTAFLDSAFSSCVFQLAISQFPSQYLPEIIGMTLYLEWSAPPELRVFIALLEERGIDPHFYSLHLAIDNPFHGHGGFAKDVVNLYLGEIRAHSGETAVQTYWQRIWDGYVAFRTVSTLGEDLRTKLASPPSLHDKMIEMLKSKANKAQLMHGDKQLKDPNTGELRPFNDFFKDPALLLEALQSNNFVIAGKPDESPFFRLLDFKGRMYKVFSEEEIGMIRKWVSSLQPKVPTPKPKQSPGQAMKKLLDELRGRAKGVKPHKVHKLSGPDPKDQNQTTTQPIAWWFDLNNATTTQLMLALARDPRYVKVSKPEESPLITTLLKPDHQMGIAVGPEGVQIIRDWITAGGPEPEDDVQVFALSLDYELSQDIEPRHRILGMGSVH